MLLQLRNFLKPESLELNEQLYLTARTCTCNACMGFKSQFIKECSKVRLVQLDRM